MLITILLTLLFGVNTICPQGSFEVVTPLPVENGIPEYLECGYIDSPYQTLCIKSYNMANGEVVGVNWGVVNPGLLVTAAIVEYQSGDIVVEAVSPFAYFVDNPGVLNVGDLGIYTTGDEPIDTISWCGRNNYRTFNPYIGK